MKQLWEWLTGGDALVQLLRSIDVIAVLLLVYILLRNTRDRRTVWFVRGIITLLMVLLVANWLGLQLLSFVLDKLLVGAAVAMAIVLQSEIKRILERLGRWDLLVSPPQRRRPNDNPNLITTAIAEAVKKLSQERIGALLVIETGEAIEDRSFATPGTSLNARLSAELLQTIFQPKSLLHDGAVLIRGDMVVAAGVILPISKRSAPAELGTRHRAAMGMAEAVDDCICIVVSEETGSIAIAEGDKLNRPVSNNDLREFLEERFMVHRPVTMVRRRVPSFGQLLSDYWRNIFSSQAKK
jgi:uncharacterized protein (TIGR00159 family)